MLTRAFTKSLMTKQLPYSLVTFAPQRHFMDRLGLESTDITKVQSTNAPALWTDHKTHHTLALKTDDEIIHYVPNVCRDYFRTTKKQKMTLNSSLKEHGLDSLDVIELVIRIEDDLGYVIDAENLDLFKKPKHFVNYIKSIESYRSEFNRLPTDGIKAKFNFKEALKYN